MKIKDGFIKRQVVGQWIVVPTEKLSKEYNGIIELNSTAAEIWDGVAEELSAEEIAKRLTEKYTIEYDKALEDVNKIINQMIEQGIIE